VLIEPAKDTLLGKVVQSWKGASAREINKLTGRHGTLWQKEAFDHIVRSEEQLEHFRRYIASNPSKAKLKTGFVLSSGRAPK
jgi:putative transposase